MQKNRIIVPVEFNSGLDDEPSLDISWKNNKIRMEIKDLPRIDKNIFPFFHIKSFP